MRRRAHTLRRRYGRAQPQIGKGARGYIQSHHRYAIVGLVPNRKSGGYLKTRHVVGRARDAHEALAKLYELTETQRASGAYDSGRWHYIVLDVGRKHGSLTPTVTEDELRRRQAAGQ